MREKHDNFPTHHRNAIRLAVDARTASIRTCLPEPIIYIRVTAMLLHDSDGCVFTFT